MVNCRAINTVLHTVADFKFEGMCNFGLEKSDKNQRSVRLSIAGVPSVGRLMMMKLLAENFAIAIDCHAVQGVENKPGGFFKVQQSCPSFGPAPPPFFNLCLFLIRSRFSSLKSRLTVSFEEVSTFVRGGCVIIKSLAQDLEFS